MILFIRPTLCRLVLASLLAAPILRGEALSTVAAKLQPFVEKHELAGAVGLVTDREKDLEVTTVGFADISKNQPMAADSLFWIASESKPITATAVMMLVEEGKIALDDPVEKYLPEFRGQMVVAEKTDGQVTLHKPVHPITVREVLSIVWMVQHAGFPGEGGKAQDTFKRWSAELAAKPR